MWTTTAICTFTIANTIIWSPPPLYQLEDLQNSPGNEWASHSRQVISGVKLWSQDGHWSLIPSARIHSSHAYHKQESSAVSLASLIFSPSPFINVSLTLSHVWSLMCSCQQSNLQGNCKGNFSLLSQGFNAIPNRQAWEPTRVIYEKWAQSCLHSNCC